MRFTAIVLLNFACSLIYFKYRMLNQILCNVFQIFGNAAGFFILYIDRHVSNRLNATHQVNYSVCGSHDCQDGDITRANLEQYSPTYDTTRYIVIAVFSLFVLVAAGIHLIFLPNDNLSVLSEKLQSIQIDGDETIAETELVEKLTVGSHIEKEKENEEPKKVKCFKI